MTFHRLSQDKWNGHLLCRFCQFIHFTQHTVDFCQTQWVGSPPFVSLGNPMTECF